MTASWILVLSSRAMMELVSAINERLQPSSALVIARPPHHAYAQRPTRTNPARKPNISIN
jgi:hypothetical protein